MDTVYVVTAGDYSAYHIVGIFTDKKEAEAYVERRNRGALWNQSQVEEYPLNQLINRKYLYKTSIYKSMFARNGVYNIETHTEYVEPEEGHPDNKYESGIFEDRFVPGNKFVIGYAETAEKSQKIAQDLWAQLQAEEAGI